MPHSHRIRTITLLAGLAGLSLGAHAALSQGSPSLPPPPSAPEQPGLGEDESGGNLWLHYRTVDDPAARSTYHAHATEVIVPGSSIIAGSTRAELTFGLSHLLAHPVPAASAPSRDGAVLAGTTAGFPFLAEPFWATDLNALSPDGFLIRSTMLAGHRVTVIASPSDRGALYGAFAFLRRIKARLPITGLLISDEPAHDLRMWQDWNNWDGSVERGYAGRSHLQLETLPTAVHPRNLTHARAMATVGLNGYTPNSVNAQPEWIDSRFLPRVASLAALRRRYGIQTFLSVRFDSPILLGGLPTADPLDPAVIAWWKAKADEVYQHIPDFGGFLVKADSEGQPGPARYGRSHADGASMLAAALRPHGGIVLWRAFVYEGIQDPDRSKRSFALYHPQDGRFGPGTMLQIKNGPVDFQTREPVHPLFGRMPRTHLALELQITQEYTGQATHLCWLVPQWNSCLDFDLAVPGAARSTLADVVRSGAFPHDPASPRILPTLIAGVSNMGSDINWTGHPLAQANHFGFGRLAWNPALDAADIAEEWIRVTYGDHPRTVATLRDLLLRSWTTCEDSTLVGAPRIVTALNHFDPELTAARLNSFGLPFVSPTHIGCDRTRATGSAAVNQYNPPVADRFDSLATCPPELLFSFHKVPFTHEVRPGLTVIQWIYDANRRAVNDVGRMIAQWEGLRESMSAVRHAAVRDRLLAQHREAKRWRHTAHRFFFDLTRIPDAQGGPDARP